MSVYYTVQRPDGTCLMVCEPTIQEAILRAQEIDSYLRQMGIMQAVGYRVVEVGRVVAKGEE